MYVGNADEDVFTARNSNVLDVLVDRNEFKFPGLNPTHTIKSLHELEYLLFS
jgi:hypothetical protein